MTGDPTLVLRNCAVWDGHADTLSEPMDIVVAGDTIDSVTEPGARRAAAATEIDLDGRIVMPGLVDMHVHLVWSGGADPAAEVAADGEHLTAVRAAVNAVQHLQAGITTVRDLGSNWDLAVTIAQAVDRGLLDGPTVVAAGQTVIMTGGHDPFWGLASDGVEAVVRSVRRQVSIGASVIKTAATGGVYGRPHGEDIGQTELSREELTAIAAEAHRFGLRVAAHALGTEGIRNAVLAGIDTIEHGNFLDDDIIEQMRSRGTALCPTLHIYRVIARRDGVPEYAAAKARTAVDAHRESFRMAREAGIPIVAGTDAGSVLTPHPALVDELTVMCEYGMTPVEALRTATVTAGEVLGQHDTVGVVTKGARADLLVLDADPTKNIEVLRAPRFVVGRGRVATTRQ